MKNFLENNAIWASSFGAGLFTIWAIDAFTPNEGYFFKISKDWEFGYDDVGGIIAMMLMYGFLQFAKRRRSVV